MNETFRSELKLNSSQWDIDHSHKILTIGSCFADEMGGILAEHKFNVMVNPLGTIYNPLTICTQLNSVMSGHTPESATVEHNGLFANLYFHSSFNATSKEALNDNIESQLERVREYLQETDYLVITLGTAWVFKYNETGERIGNCHKIPSSQFTREILNPREVIKPLEEVSAKLREFRPGLKIIYTVSPVRHLRDGIIENQSSKAMLRVGTHYLAEQDELAEYFPSYEIVLDDLRDYRFYKEDMIHPNEQANEYIWGKFEEVYFSNDTRELNKEIRKAKRAMNHRPFHPGSDSHLTFLKETLSQLIKLNERVNLDIEIKDLENRIETHSS